jgi:hypothetical protein
MQEDIKKEEEIVMSNQDLDKLEGEEIIEDDIEEPEIIHDGLLDAELAESSNLNPSQELFCQLYAKHEEFFGNGVQSYIEAYNPDQTRPNWYKSACSSASRLLSNVKVIDRINSILEETGMNDAFIDKQLSFLITQHADFTNKLGAIKEYNKLKARITDKMDLTSKGEAITGINFIRNDSNKSTTNN